MTRKIVLFMLPLLAVLTFNSCNKDDDDDMQRDKSKGNGQMDDTREPYLYNCIERCSDFANTNGYEYVDLGLPSGNLWAVCNLGADTKTMSGMMYAWGELESKSVFDDAHYQYYHSSANGSGLTKYVPKAASAYGCEGFYDGEVVLKLEDDVVHSQMGGSWRMPTECDYKELLDCCSLYEKTYDGVRGYEFLKNGKRLFFPLTGVAEGSSINGVGVYAYYLTSGEDEYYPNYAVSLNLCKTLNRMVSDKKRSCGYAIRGVCPSRK